MPGRTSRLCRRSGTRPGHRRYAADGKRMYRCRSVRRGPSEAYCVMRTHWLLVIWLLVIWLLVIWLLVIWPRKDGELSRFAGWLTLTPKQRWHAHRHSTGPGHIYPAASNRFPSRMTVISSRSAGMWNATPCERILLRAEAWRRNSRPYFCRLD